MVLSIEYMFCSHDTSVENTTYHMQDWHIWSTVDFREWTLECVVKPESFFMGKCSDCWAIDALEKDGKYYLYYSNKNIQTGVAVANHPEGPYIDAKGSPILDGNLTNTPEYDPAVFTDEDGSSYIVFGGPKWAYGKGAGYYIAKLAESRIELDEKPRRLQLDLEGDDKASLNKIGGTYYLSWGSFYAISDSIYGPYKFIGNTGASEDHGSYVEYNGQLFNSFTVFDPTMVHRASGVCYVHQRANKELVVDELIVEYGVGHYDTNWNKIQSQWYMCQEQMKKVENPRYGFDMLTSEKGTLWYPNLENTKGKKGISFFVSSSSEQGARIEVREQKDGTIIGSCEVKGTGSSWRSYCMFPCILDKEIGNNLHLTIEVIGSGEARLDYFKFFKKNN